MAQLQIETSVTLLNETNMYIITDLVSRHAILIDPSDAIAAEDFLQKKDLLLDYIILTHEHYDHIAALNQLRELFPAKVVASDQCSTRIQNPRENMSHLFDVILEFKRQQGRDYGGDIHIEPYKAEAADLIFHGKKELEWQGHRIAMQEAPGHSPGSILIDIDNKYLFSGDTLLYDYPIITRFPGGSKRQYQSATKPLLQGLEKKICVYPGHGRTFILEEMESF